VLPDAGYGPRNPDRPMILAPIRASAADVLGALHDQLSEQEAAEVELVFAPDPQEP
jgi:hypothetical protein